MEPNVATIALHPAVLIASGFECITSNQVKFLNAHRRHFHHKVYDLDKTISVTQEDFSLGGILNPYGEFLDTREAQLEAAEKAPSFPYLTRRSIIKAFYQEELSSIWSELLIELFEDLSEFCVVNKRPKGYYVANTKVIHELYSYPIYHKISSLHLCGLGSKLIDAFDYVFELYKSYEEMRAEPAAVRK